MNAALWGLLAAAVAPPGEDIRDIRGPIAVAQGHPGWLYALAVCAALAVVGALGFFSRRRRTITPEELALRILEGARPAMERQDALAFSAQVSDAVRGYVEEAFGVRAPRRTTEELLADLMTDGSPVAAHRSELGQFLGFCDLAKYARTALSQDDMAGMLASAQAFVRSTAAARPTKPELSSAAAASAIATQGART